MRKLIASNMISIDGFFEGPDKDLSGFKIDNGLYEPMVAIFDRMDTILLGRETYEFFAAYWPTKTRSDDPAADFINNSNKIVFSKNLKQAPWGKWKEGVVYNDNMVETVRQLKEEPGKDMVIFGSGSVVNQLSQADLIDEYRFIVNPVILGNGKLMFDHVDLNHQLKLKTASILNSGIIILDYERN